MKFTEFFDSDFGIFVVFLAAFMLFGGLGMKLLFAALIALLVVVLVKSMLNYLNHGKFRLWIRKTKRPVEKVLEEALRDLKK